MKKSVSISMLLLIPALVTSCWLTDEDWSLCPTDTPQPDNLTLKFRVHNTVNAEFEEHIDNVDVFLFGADRFYLEQRQALQSEADGSRSASFTVTPGIYHVVCWANVGDNSRISPMGENSNFENSFVEIAGTETGDPVYDAPYKAPQTRSALSLNTPNTRADGDYDIYAVEVLPNTHTVKELVFVKVHRKIDLFISGYELTDGYDGLGPLVEKTNASWRFDFLLRPHGVPMSLKRASMQQTVNEKEMYTTHIISALVPLTDDQNINIIHPSTGETLATVNLAQYISANNITDDTYIPIHIAFGMDAAVKITMPSWIDIPIDVTPVG
jgi:hypothetical protein